MITTLQMKEEPGMIKEEFGPNIALCQSRKFSFVDTLKQFIEEYKKVKLLLIEF